MPKRALRSGRTRAAAFGMLVLVAASACGSDDGGGGDEASGSSPAAEPIRVLQMGDYQAATGTWPSQLDGAKAAAESINADGGINGRLIEIIDCNTRGDVNEGAKCAREGVNGGAIANVGSQMLQSQASTKVLEDASMASVGIQPLAPVDYTSEISFPLISGAATSTAAGCAGLVDVGGVTSDVAVFGVDIAAGKTARDVCQNALEVRDVSSFVVVAPPGAPDMAPTVAQAMAKNPKAVILATLPGDVVKIVQAFQQAGFDGVYGGNTSLLTNTPEIFEALAPLVDGGFFGSKLPLADDTDNDALADYHADMEKYAPKAALDDYSLNAYLAMRVFADVARTIEGELTAESFLAAMGQATVEVAGLGDIDFSASAGIPGQPRIFNDKAGLYQLEGGKLRSVAEPFAPGQAPDN